MAKTTAIIESIFRARDDVSAAIKRMEKNSSNFGKTAENSFKKASKSANRFRDITGGILSASLIKKGVTQLSAGIGTVTTQFIGFDDAIVSASAKFGNMNEKTIEGKKRLDAIKKSAREMGATTQFTATEAAQGLDFLALAGFSAEQSMAALPGVVDLATNAQTDLARATDIASDSLGAFGLMTKDSTQLQINFARVNDVMAKTMTSTNTSIEDMFEAIKKGAPDFINSGQSMETFNAALGVMANAGVKGSEAGTKLRNVMLRLAKPTAEAMDTLDDLGVVTEDSQGNFRDIIDILADFEKGLVGMGTAQRAAALATVFGARTVGGINIILKAGTKNLRNFRTSLENSGGASKKMADIMRSSLGNQIKSLQSAAIDLGFKFLNAFKKDGVSGIQSLTQAIRSFDVMPIINGIKDVFSLLSSIVTVVKSITTLMVPFLAAWAAYNLVLTIINAKLILLTIGSKAFAAATWLINAALAANPIGLIVAGVVGLIAGLVLLVKHWDTVKKAFVDGANAIFNIFSKIFSIASNLTGGIFKSVLDVNDGRDKDKQAAGGSAVDAGPQIFAPPNATEAQASKVNFSGLMTFKNAPQGATFENNVIGAPPIAISGLGEN